MKGWLIGVALKWVAGILKSDKETLKGKVVDGLKGIPNEYLEEGITKIAK